MHYLIVWLNFVQEELIGCLFLWWDFCCRAWFREVYSFLIFSFNSACLMVSTSNIFKFLEFFFFPSVLILSLLGTYLPSVIRLFPFFLMGMVYFSLPNSIIISWQYIHFVCISFQFFFIFCKYLDVIHLYKMIDLFLWFCKFVALSALPTYLIGWHHNYYK